MEVGDPRPSDPAPPAGTASACGDLCAAPRPAAWTHRALDEPPAPRALRPTASHPCPRALAAAAASSVSAGKIADSLAPQPLPACRLRFGSLLGPPTPQVSGSGAPGRLCRSPQDSRGAPGSYRVLPQALQGKIGKQQREGSRTCQQLCGDKAKGSRLSKEPQCGAPRDQAQQVAGVAVKRPSLGRCEAFRSSRAAGCWPRSTR